MFNFPVELQRQDHITLAVEAKKVCPQQREFILNGNTIEDYCPKGQFPESNMPVTIAVFRECQHGKPKNARPDKHLARFVSLAWRTGHLRRR
jgi:hypothetical protein